MPLRVMRDVVQIRSHRSLLCEGPIGVAELLQNNGFQRRRVVANFLANIYFCRMSKPLLLHQEHAEELGCSRVFPNHT